MRSPRSAGFTLIELLVAMSLATVVLIGIVSMATSLVRYQFEGIRKGEISGATLIALSQMNRQIENATYLNDPPPTPPGSASDALSGCTNFSSVIGGPYNSAEQSTMFYYCVRDETGSLCPSGRWGCRTLVRYTKTSFTTTCPPVAPGNCGDSVTWGGSSVPGEPIIVSNFYKLDDMTNYFYRSMTGITTRYIVGYSTATTNIPLPVAYKVNTRVAVNKSYGNTSD